MENEGCEAEMFPVLNLATGKIELVSKEEWISIKDAYELHHASQEEQRNAN